MKTIASYQEPKCQQYRNLVGISNYVDLSKLDWFETRHICAADIKELAFIMKLKTLRNSHVGQSRPLDLTDGIEF